MIPEMLKPKGLHAHGNLVFDVCISAVKKQTKSHAVKLTASIKTDVAQFLIIYINPKHVW